MRLLRRTVLLACIAALTVGCQRGRERHDAAANRNAGSGQAADKLARPESTTDSPASALRIAALNSEDVLPRITSMNERVRLPEAQFRQGEVEPLKFDAEKITKTANGFVIRLPSESPIPMPTVHGGRLYISGGFSSRDYYCFDARSGEILWGAELDDDGPSSAVPFDESIIFSCESCTIFVLAADTGRMLWSHWLGDPLLSSPIVSDGRVVITYPAGREEELSTDEVDDKGDINKADDESGGLKRKTAKGDQATVAAGTMVPEENPHPYILACLDAKSGDVLWRRWLDSDCMSAPVAVGRDLYVTTLSGTLYRLRLSDGQFERAERLRATSVPVIVGDKMFMTRRADEGDKDVAECIVLYARNSHVPRYSAAKRAAPYLDQMVQRKSGYSGAASAFEAPNGIGGGFGGGFSGGATSGGHFSVPDMHLEQQEPQADAAVHATATLQNVLADAESQPQDALAATQRGAAANIGLGNVSTLQSFQGSRILYWNKRLYNCMGDQVICAAAASGDILWTIALKGDLAEVGGHLAAPPVAAGRFLFVATVGGEVLRIEPQSGNVEERYVIGSPMRFSPVVDGGRIYVSTQDGKVVCIDTGDRQLTGWPMRGRDAAHSNVVDAD